MRNHYADGMKAAAEVLGLQKTSARRGLKILKGLYEQGRFNEVDRLAKRPGYVRPTEVGSYMKMLSPRDKAKWTAEGPVFSAVSPDGGLRATKMYDRDGAATAKALELKERVGNLNHPAAVPIKSKTVPGLDHKLHTMEFLTAGTARRAHIGQKMKAEKQVKDFQRHARTKGLEISDIDGNPDNYTADGRLFDPIVGTTRKSGKNAKGVQKYRKGVFHMNPEWSMEKRVDPMASLQRQMRAMQDARKGVTSP